MRNAVVEGGRELEFGLEEKALCAICEAQATKAVTTGALEGEKPRDLSFRFDCPKCGEYQISHSLMCQVDCMRPLSKENVKEIRNVAITCHKQGVTLTSYHVEKLLNA